MKSFCYNQLAMFIWNDGKGQKLEELPGLCTTEKSPDCVTSYTVKFPNCVRCFILINIYFMYIAIHTNRGICTNKEQLFQIHKQFPKFLKVTSTQAAFS